MEIIQINSESRGQTATRIVGNASQDQLRYVDQSPDKESAENNTIGQGMRTPTT